MILKEIYGDLFQMGKEYSLAHCVAADLRMGAGIAVTFKNEFNKLDELLNQRASKGGLALLNLSEAVEMKRFIYYLITKRESTGKPTYATLRSSLERLRDHISSNEVKKLAIPRLGCGLDRLQCQNVRAMLKEVFHDIDVQIIVFNFRKTAAQFNTCTIYEVPYTLKDISNETLILYFTDENGGETDLMKNLSEEFPLMEHFRRSSKGLGEIIRYVHQADSYILYGCVVRKRPQDPFDFVSFGKCLLQINNLNDKDQYLDVATQLSHDLNDDMFDKKIVTLMINWLRNVNVYICNVKQVWVI